MSLIDVLHRPSIHTISMYLPIALKCEPFLLHLNILEMQRITMLNTCISTSVDRFGLMNWHLRILRISKIRWILPKLWPNDLFIEQVFLWFVRRTDWSSMRIINRSIDSCHTWAIVDIERKKIVNSCNRARDRYHILNDSSHSM